MADQVALIACCARKLSHSASARELYQGTLFRYSVRYVEQVLHIPWYVLSAKWGLVRPDQELAPYNETLRDASKSVRRAWAWGVAQALGKQELNTGERTWLLFAGREYRDALVPLLRGTICVPLRGLGIGQQIALLKEWTRG